MASTPADEVASTPAAEEEKVKTSPEAGEEPGAASKELASAEKDTSGMDHGMDNAEALGLIAEQAHQDAEKVQNEADAKLKAEQEAADAVYRQQVADAEAVAAEVERAADELEQKRAEILDYLKSVDATVHELFTYCYTHYDGLKKAFRSLDMNGNGQLSKSEFVTGLVVGQADPLVKGSTKPSIAEVHMRALFERLVRGGNGSQEFEDYQKAIAAGETVEPWSTTIDKLVEQIDVETTDPVITRFREFVTQVEKKTNLAQDVSKYKDGEKIPTESKRKLLQMFKVPEPKKGRPTQIAREASEVLRMDDPIGIKYFVDALNKMKYPSWHSSKLFRQMDHDNSGMISLKEFVVLATAAQEAKWEPIKAEEEVVEEADAEEVKEDDDDEEEKAKKLAAADPSIAAAAEDASRRNSARLSRRDSKRVSLSVAEETGAADSVDKRESLVSVKTDTPARTFADASTVKPAEGAGSVSITIVGTEGLPKDPTQKGKLPSRWCACEAPGSDNTMYKTPKVADSLNPTWSHGIVIQNYKFTSCLQFTVMDEDVVASATLNTSDFYPESYKASVQLLDGDGTPIPKAMLKLEVTGIGPFKGEPTTGGDALQSNQNEEGEDVATGPAARRHAQYVNFNADGEPEALPGMEGIEAETRSWASSSFFEESEGEPDDVAADDDDDEKRRKRSNRKAVTGDEEDEALRARARAQYQISILEQRAEGENAREKTQTEGLEVDAVMLDARVVWVCGSKVTPCEFRSAIHKKTVVAELAADKPAVKVTINSVTPSRTGGWKARWDCVCFCQVLGNGPSKGAANKFQTEMVRNMDVPTWNTGKEFNITSGETLDFSIEGVDRDGFPKTPGILGRVCMPRDQILPQGFAGELDLVSTRENVNAKLKVEVAVLCLWDADTDKQVPLEKTKEALTEMKKKTQRSAKIQWEKEAALTNTPIFQETYVKPMTVFDLLTADAVRRKKDKRLNIDITEHENGTVLKKQPWVWREVSNVFNRVIYDPPVRSALAKQENEAAMTAKAGPMSPQMPRPHLKASDASQVEDSQPRAPDNNESHSEPQMAIGFSPNEKVRMRHRNDSESSDASEDWDGASEDDGMIRPYGKKLSVSPDQVEATARVVANAPELLDWKKGDNVASSDARPFGSEVSRRASMTAALDQDPDAAIGAKRRISTGAERGLEGARRASAGGAPAGRYRDMWNKLQAVGITPSEMRGSYSDGSDSDEPKAKAAEAKKKKEKKGAKDAAKSEKKGSKTEGEGAAEGSGAKDKETKPKQKKTDAEGQAEKQSPTSGQGSKLDPVAEEGATDMAPQSSLSGSPKAAAGKSKAKANPKAGIRRQDSEKPANARAAAVVPRPVMAKQRQPSRVEKGQILSKDSKIVEKDDKADSPPAGTKQAMRPSARGAAVRTSLKF